MSKETPEEKIKSYGAMLQTCREEIAKAVVGQTEVVNALLRGIVANGHILVEGVPGTGKTLLVRALAEIMGCEFKRIQFTPDLLPSDIVGINTYEKERGFYVLKGPIFSNFLLADEINRAPPKVQSALLEGMQERQVTIGRETFELPLPFFVMATQNPIENLGTFPLPEAQVDRFMFKLNVGYPSVKEEQEVLRRNMTIHKFEAFGLKPIMSTERIMEMQESAKNIFLHEKIERYIVSIIDATRNPQKYDIKLGKYIEWGASPRASLGLFIGSKAEALLDGKNFVTPFYVRKVASDVLRHRISINYEGQTEGVNSEMIVKEILERVPIP
jgi:MoxR-like ATPase